VSHTTHTTHQTPEIAPVAPLNLKMDMEPPTTADEEEWVYAWEEELFDEDGQLWVITMMSLMVMPFYETFYITPILLNDFLIELIEK
jgi:hypothetical protein